MAIITAASGSYADVNTAVNTTAVDGDTVLIPAGTWSWTQQLAINNKQLVIQGAGIDQTVILHNVPVAVYGKIGMAITINEPKKFRLSGFTVRGDTDHDISFNGFISLFGTSQSVRLDHIKFDQIYSSGIWCLGGNNGVVDNVQTVHSFFNPPNAMSINHPSWLGVGAEGDNSWAQPSTLGQAGAMYVEDTTFNVQPSALASINGIIDSGQGGRQVVRFSSCNNCGWQNHGTESGQRHRGGRQFEFYQNTITKSGGLNVDSGAFVRSGTGTFWGNTWADTSVVNAGIKLVLFRLVGSYGPWGYADGVAHGGASSPWDVTDGVQQWTGTPIGAAIALSNITYSAAAKTLTRSTGSWVTDNYTVGDIIEAGYFDPGLIRQTFTVAAVAATVLTVTENVIDHAAISSQVGPLYLKVTGAPWTANQYSPGLDNCSVREVTQGWAAEINTHTPNFLTPYPSLNSELHHFSAGDTVEIRCTTIILDQPGRGMGDYISGGNTTIPPTPYGWPHEALEPIYSWNNSAAFFTSGQNGSTHMAANRDFYQDAGASCSGGPTGSCSTGVGVGPRSMRPNNCTPGTAWWATDQGSWNTKLPANTSGVLDKCVQTNTWQNAAYVPYTYPHPLRSDPFIGDSAAAPIAVIGPTGRGVLRIRRRCGWGS